MLFDLHVHTTCSFDGRMSPEELIVSAVQCGLDGVAVTDHKTMDIRHHIREGLQPNGLVVIFGMEYDTEDGDFLIFGPFEDLPLDLSADELLRSVERSGGVAVAAHPFRENRPINENLMRRGLCRIAEGYNGRNTVLENIKMEKWRRIRSLLEVSASDAHTVEELCRIATRLLQPVRTRADLIQVLKTGAFQSASAPIRAASAV